MAYVQSGVSDMIKHVDLDNDEVVDFNEFCAMMVRMVGHFAIGQKQLPLI